jgi:hypothetical protein
MEKAEHELKFPILRKEQPNTPYLLWVAIPRRAGTAFCRKCLVRRLRGMAYILNEVFIHVWILNQVNNKISEENPFMFGWMG